MIYSILFKFLLPHTIKEALREIELITKQQAKIKDADDLEAVEKKIIKATDKLAGLITAQKIQQALDPDEIKQQTKELINTLPKPMKNQGQREVEIIPSRGEPVKVRVKKNLSTPSWHSNSMGYLLPIFRC